MQDYGIREGLKYRNISWLMSGVDIEDVIFRLGSKVSHRTPKVVMGYCPDHHLFTGRKPSHPKWAVSIHTGETFCFTEGRGSNLVWTVCRLLDCPPKEAVKFLLGTDADVDEGVLVMSAWKHQQLSLRRKEEEEKAVVKGLETIQAGIESHFISDAAYQFFMSPPGKKPTNILRETVNHFRVFERTWGYYSNRVIVPFFMKSKLMGFCAIDILGKDEWVKNHPLKTPDDYKKVLYPMDLSTGDCLFGFDECQKGADLLVVTEGARDVMKLWQEGYANAVAILGSFMGDNQVKLLTELAPKRVALLFDGDDAGRTITGRVAQKLSRIFAGKRLAPCFMPPGFDPKNMNRSGFEVVIKAV